MAKGIKRQIKIGLNAVNQEVADLQGNGSLYARGLASEGYAGGYRDALNDVLLLLNGVAPSTRGYWSKLTQSPE